MLRLVLVLFCAGLFLIGSGGYDLFVQAGASRQPTSISIAELQRALPGNRHLIVTGGHAVAQTAVAFYKTKWGSKVSGSGIYFIPITDPASSMVRGSTPALLLRVTEAQMDEAKAGKKIDFGAVEGIRTTSFELEDKARQRLVESYGQAAVEQMVILNYHGAVGMGEGLGKLAGGLVLTAAVVVGFISLRKRKASPPPIPSPLPPVIPTGPVG